MKLTTSKIRRLLRFVSPKKMLWTEKVQGQTNRSQEKETCDAEIFVKSSAKRDVRAGRRWSCEKVEKWRNFRQTKCKTRCQGHRWSCEKVDEDEIFVKSSAKRDFRAAADRVLNCRNDDGKFSSKQVRKEMAGSPPIVWETREMI